MMKRSIYTKLVLSFIIIFVVSNIIASLMSYYGTEMNSVENLENQLVKTLEIIQKEDKQEALNFESIERINENNYITVLSREDINNYKLDQSTIDQIDAGNIVHIRAKEHHDESNTGPIAVLKLDEHYIIATANFENLGFSTRQLVMEINIRSLIIGSLLVIAVARLMVKPIKQLIEATHKVSKKDFDVHLDSKRKDELGTLINSFNDMTDELKATEILRDDFISDVSHEFKTPLTSIKGYTKLLEGATEQEQKEYIEIIVEETDRLSKLTSSILTLNRLEQETKKDYDAFRLDEQIRKTLVLLEHKWTSKNLSIDLDVEEVMYQGDEVLLSQVWFNLIDNAIKFSSENSKIKIRLKQTDHVYVEIQDYGLGINEADQGRIFDKFYKEDRSRREDGNGLGLAIVKKVIDLHNGEIKVSSAIHEGTRFEIKL